jgi:hypothetical protein
MNEGWDLLEGQGGMMNGVAAVLRQNFREALCRIVSRTIALCLAPIENGTLWNKRRRTLPPPEYIDKTFKYSDLNQPIKSTFVQDNQARITEDLRILPQRKVELLARCNDESANLANAEGMSCSMKELTDACSACHAAHREKLSDGSFQIK